MSIGHQNKTPSFPPRNTKFYCVNTRNNTVWPKTTHTYTRRRLYTRRSNLYQTRGGKTPKHLIDRHVYSWWQPASGEHNSLRKEITPKASVPGRRINDTKNCYNLAREILPPRSGKQPYAVRIVVRGRRAEEKQLSIHTQDDDREKDNESFPSLQSGCRLGNGKGKRHSSQWSKRISFSPPAKDNTLLIQRGVRVREM